MRSTVWAVFYKPDDDRFKDETPRALVRQQKEHWDPLFEWTEKVLGAKLKVADGFAPAKQDAEAVENLRKIVDTFDAWQLAGESSINPTDPKQCSQLLAVGLDADYQRSSAQYTPRNPS